MFRIADLESSIDTQSNLFTLIIHLSLILFMAFTIQWKPKNPYFAEVELWEAIPTKTAENQMTPIKELDVEKQVTKKEIVKEIPKQADVDAEISLKKKKEKIKKLQEELLKQEQIKQLQERLLNEEKSKRIEKEKLEKLQEMLRSEEVNQKSDRIAIQADKDVEAGVNSGELDKYKALIQQKIQQNVNNNLCGTDYISLDFEIKLLPSGELLSDPVLKKSSKNPSCDEAVERAIFISEPLPVPTDPKLFAKLKQLRLKFYPNGQPE